MPRRIKEKNKSIFVKFHEETTDKKIESMLAELGVSGTRVSNLINRWAIEIPFWKEDFYVSKLEESELVDVVHDSFDRKRKNYSGKENSIEE